MQGNISTKRVQKHSASHGRAFLALLLFLVSLLTLLLAGCGSSGGPSVATDFDPKADFTRYHTFSYRSGRIMLQGDIPDSNNTLLDNRIRDAVTDALEAKGLRPDSANPDLVVTYIAGAHNRQEIQDLGPEIGAYGFGPRWYGPGYYGGGGWWGPSYERFWVRNYTQGTLIVDLIDAHTHQLAWRAYVSGEVHGKPDAKQVRKVVDRVFRDYPPKPGS